MVGLNHLHSDEPQPNLRRRCSRQQLAKGAAGCRLAVDLGDEVAHAKPGRVASATLDHTLVIWWLLGSTEIPSVPPLRLSVTVRARFFAPEEPPASSSAVLRARLRWGAESAVGVISLSASSNFQPAC